MMISFHYPLLRNKSNIIKGLTFNDQQATPQLNELKNKYPANLIVITGELTIDLPDKIDKYVKPSTFKTFNLSSNRLTFNNCLLDDVIAVLEGQYATAQRLALRDLEEIRAAGRYC